MKKAKKLQNAITETDTGAGQPNTQDRLHEGKDSKKVQQYNNKNNSVSFSHIGIYANHEKSIKIRFID